MLILIPIFGIIFVLMSVEEENTKAAKRSALWTSIINFLLSFTYLLILIKLYLIFNLLILFSWFNNENLKFSLGVDGISLPFIVLSTFLIPLCIFFMWENKKNKIKLYLSSFLLIESFLIGAFSAIDLFSFYIFF